MTKAFSPKDVFAMMVNSNPEVKAQWYVEQINAMIATEDYTRSNMVIDMGAIQSAGAPKAMVCLTVQFVGNDVSRMSEALCIAIATKLREAGWTDVVVDMTTKKITSQSTTDLYGMDLGEHTRPTVSSVEKNRMTSLAEASLGSSESEEIGNALGRLGAANAESKKIKVSSDQPFNRGSGINPFYHSKSV